MKTYLFFISLLVFASCTKLQISDDAGSGLLVTTLPGFSDLSGASSLSYSSGPSSKISSLSLKSSILSAHDFSLSPPNSLAQFTCFAIAVDVPNDGSKKCGRSDGKQFSPGLMQGLYKAGESVAFSVPSGSSRKIYLLGFAGTSSDDCVNLQSKYLPKVNLSAPVILGEVSADINKDGSTVINITPDLVSAVSLSSCDDEVFQPTAPTDTTPPPTVTNPVPAPPDADSAPKANSYACGDNSVSGLSEGAFACYGLWDFSNAFGDDRNMCGSGGAAITNPTTGCYVDTDRCTSGRAIASSVYNVYKPWDSSYDNVDYISPSKLTEVASRLGASEDVVTSNLIRIWEYQCAPASADPEPEPRAQCPAETLSLTYTDSGYTYTCAGPMPESNAGENGVYGVSAVPTNMTKTIWGMPMTGYTTGPSCLLSDFGVHNSTLSGEHAGTCLNYCTVIADCGANGYWKNIRYTW